MAENRGFDIADFVLFILRKKKTLALFLLIVTVVSYLAIYFLIEEEFEGSATIIPTEEASLGNLSSMMRSFSSLPLNLGGAKKSSEMDLYNTIIYSRSSIETLIDRFRLDSLYGISSRAEAVKTVRRMITVEVTVDNAYVIHVRANARQLAADMTNFVVDMVNEKVIDLNVGKSRENRRFLEQRYADIKREVRLAEDSLAIFQHAYGMYEAKEQVKGTLDALTRLESDLAIKEIDYSLVKRLYGADSPQVKNAEATLKAFEAKLNDLKTGRDPSSLFIPLGSLPNKAMRYFRLYRSVEIGNKLLEYVIPLYEQAKIEEKRETPILQIIDRAIPPEKKMYPPRVAMTGVIALLSFCVFLVYLIVRERLRGTTDPKVMEIRQGLRLRKRSE
jgi:tyrosine-protein kinase Etk/Wzc